MYAIQIRSSYLRNDADLSALIGRGFVYDHVYSTTLNKGVIFPNITAVARAAARYARAAALLGHEDELSTCVAQIVHVEVEKVERYVNLGAV